MKFLYSLLLAGLASLCQSQLRVDWKTTSYLNLGVDCYQTLQFPKRDITELNPIAKGFQRTLGHEAGTVLYFSLSAVVLDKFGRRNPWVYPCVAIGQIAVVLHNRKLGAGGMPLIWFSKKF